MSFATPYAPAAISALFRVGKTAAESMRSTAYVLSNAFASC